MSPGMFGSSNMFPSSRENPSKGDDFFQLFGNANSSNRTTETRKPENEGVDRDDAGLFDFEPQTNPASPFQNQFSTPGASEVPWSNDMNFRPLSPPTSATFSPKEWSSYGFENHHPGNILTNIDPANTRAQYGQVTPPDDENDNKSLFDYQLSDQHQPIQPQQSDPPPRKRKRNTGEQDSAPPKRNRKHASRGAETMDNNDKPEDVKRSKFLERNRVAASKCRQKKKEWTQNLETRARELQKDNNLLRMNVESLREEVLFLKGEMLKHKSCDCHEIQEFITSGMNPFTDRTDGGMVFKRESSTPAPVHQMPVSDRESRGSSSSSSGDEPSKSSIVDDENALEALLSSSINHNSCEEGMTSQVDE